MYLYQSINPNEELTIGELTGEEQKCLQLAFGKNNFLEMFHYQDLGGRFPQICTAHIK